MTEVSWLAPGGDAAATWALFAVFVTCVVAGSMVPVSSEVAVAGAALAGIPVAPLIVSATLGNVIGACLNYAAGRLGAGWWRRWRASRGEERDAATPFRQPRSLEARVQAWILRWGAPAMLMSWLPVVGDPLTVVAGALGIAFVPFLIWVTVGKAARYVVVVGATGAIAEAIRW